MEFARSKRVSLALDMAPLIDCVFQLLIFFMLTSSFGNPALKLTLPKAMEHDRREPEQVSVSVDRSGAVFVDAARIPLEGLEAELARRLASDPKKAVHLRGDEAMPYRLFVEVMDLARPAGARQNKNLQDGAPG